METHWRGSFCEVICMESIYNHIQYVLWMQSWCMHCGRCLIRILVKWFTWASSFRKLHWRIRCNINSSSSSNSSRSSSNIAHIEHGQSIVAQHMTLTFGVKLTSRSMMHTSIRISSISSSSNSSTNWTAWQHAVYHLLSNAKLTSPSLPHRGSHTACWPLHS